MFEITAFISKQIRPWKGNTLVWKRLSKRVVSWFSLLAVNSSGFSCSILGLTSSSAAGLLPPLKQGVSLPTQCGKHPARVAVVALVATTLVSIAINAATRRATWWHQSSSPIEWQLNTFPEIKCHQAVDSNNWLKRRRSWFSWLKDVTFEIEHIILGHFSTVTGSIILFGAKQSRINARGIICNGTHNQIPETMTYFGPAISSLHGKYWMEKSCT